MCAVQKLLKFSQVKHIYNFVQLEVTKINAIFKIEGKYTIFYVFMISTIITFIMTCMLF